MQEDFDRIRLDHAFILDSLLTEYHQRTGTWPFAEGTDSVAAYVVIATDAQAEANAAFVRIRVDNELRGTDGKPGPAPVGVQEYSAFALQAELARALERPVSLPVDPQRVPVNKPSVYIYVLYRDVFDVSVFLHHDVAFARPLGSFHHKVALSNRSLPYSGIWTRGQLMMEPSFREFFARSFNRGGYTMRTHIER